MQFVQHATETVTAWVCKHTYVTTGVVAITTAHVLYKLANRKKGLGIIDAPPNTVVLYQLPRAPFTPSLTPFAVKLETYLRLAKIPYQNDHNTKESSKGKFPWISYNGEAVADSQLSIDYLNSKLGIDLNKNLTDAERAQAHAFRVMVDENLYWSLVYFRWIYEKCAYSVGLVVPWYIMFMIKKNAKKQLHAQGMGRHTTEEIKQKMLQDLEALSAQLGNKQYMMGDSPTEVDCSAFAMLSCLVFSFHDDITSGIVKGEAYNKH
ncbi:failed axon connections homolog isoform X4 [Elysia marginata]|uniref:Failed axon connections homolog isoform X4 n=1 Tax=Elysia marginata TaxID=1093978 RepID=A0AAV4GT03_9GAST|nr:failed axon connections homolog isoform X4 [Elysia marginata]